MSETPLLPGHKVVCIDPVDNLTLGRIYTVKTLGYGRGFIRVEEVPGDYFPSRFKVAPLTAQDIAAAISELVME